MENVACVNVSTRLRRRRAKRQGGKHLKSVEGKGRTQSRQVNKINIAV